MQWQRGEKTERQAIDQVGYSIALGAGMAAFCETLYDTLMTPRAQGSLARFTHEEALRIVCAAVQGR